MININNLSFKVKQKSLFEGLSFDLPKGSITAILGPNGRGKTTLLRLILGLQNGYDGKISVNADVAYVPQLSSSLFNYSVETMVSLGRSRHIAWYASPSIKDKNIVMQCLDYLGLTDFSSTPFNQLSGGERQMVMIARALASEPKILILDEPTSALDLHNQDRILSVLRELAQQHNMTILFTSHYPQHALHIADYSLLLHDNHQYQFGLTQHIINEPALQQLYHLAVALEPVDRERYHTTAVVPLFN